MAEGQRTNRSLVPHARQALDQLAYQTAQELGIPWGGYLGDLPSRQTGAVGGNMVRRMIALAEQQISRGSLPPSPGRAQ